MKGIAIKIFAIIVIIVLTLLVLIYLISSYVLKGTRFQQCKVELLNICEACEAAKWSGDVEKIPKMCNLEFMRRFDLEDFYRSASFTCADWLVACANIQYK